MKLKFSTITIFLVILAALSRLLPHPPNMTPIAAIGIFGAAYFSSKKASFLIPLIALFLSDLLLNNLVLRSFYPEATGVIWFSKISIFVYLGFIATILISRKIITQIKTMHIVKATLLSSLVFFLLSNFGFWLTAPNSIMTVSGLIGAYVVAIPFFLNSLIGNFVFVGLFFGLAEFVKSKNLSFVQMDTQL